MNKLVVILQCQRRDVVWPFGGDWGSEEERQAVRDYLKRVWQDNVSTHSLPPSLENTRKEATSILEVIMLQRKIPIKS